MVAVENFGSEATLEFQPRRKGKRSSQAELGRDTFRLVWTGQSQMRNSRY